MSYVISKDMEFTRRAEDLRHALGLSKLSEESLLSLARVVGGGLGADPSALHQGQHHHGDHRTFRTS